MNPDIDKACAFDRKWSKNHTTLYMLIAAVFGVAIGVAAMGLWS